MSFPISPGSNETLMPNLAKIGSKRQYQRLIHESYQFLIKFIVEQVRDFFKKSITLSDLFVSPDQEAANQSRASAAASSTSRVPRIPGTSSSPVKKVTA